MLTQSRRLLDDNAESDQMINRSTMREIKQDLNRAKLLSLFSAVLTIILYFIGTGYIVSAFCTFLAVLSAKIIESSIMVSKNTYPKR